MSKKYPSRHLNGMEENMGVDTKSIMIGEDGSITFPFIEEKSPRKSFRGRRKTMSELHRTRNRLEDTLQQERKRAELILEIRKLRSEINSLRGF